MNQTDYLPLVSIISVTYNAQQFIEETILSVLNQTYSRIEYIIIDGGSVDGTIDIIRKYESRINCWISEKDNGIYDAMNKGIRLAKGELIGMINAGDYYELDAVKLMIDAYLKTPEAGVFHGKIKLLDEKGDLIKIKTPQADLSELYKGMCVYHPTFFVQQSVYQKNGLYDTDFKIAADFDFALRNYLQKTVFCYVDQVIASFRIGGYSHVQSQKGLKEVCRILKKNGYDDELVQQVYKSLIRKDRKNNILFWGHAFLKKILPKNILDKVAQSINQR